MQRLLTYVIFCAVGASAYWFIETYWSIEALQAASIKAFFAGKLNSVQVWWFETPLKATLDSWLSTSKNLLSVVTAILAIGGKIFVWRKEKKNVADKS